MTPRNHPRSIALVALALVLCLAVLASCAAAAAPAATLGGTEVTDEQLAHEMDLFRFLSGLNQQPCGTVDGDETQDAACARFTLANVIQEHVVFEYATANDIRISDAQIQETIAQLDSNLGRQIVSDKLKEHGLTRTDLEDLARRILLFSDVERAVAAERITDAELQQQYQDGILNYTTVQVDHILVKTEAEADDVYAQVTAPGATEEDFLALAKEVSIDPSAQQNSGSLGAAVASTYVAEFGQAAAALEPGETSPPVRTEFGWHVIRMVKKDVRSFAAVQPDLIDAGSAAVFDAWIRERIKADEVEINPKYGRFDQESLQVVRISSTATGGASPPASPSA